jgi:hypothetical protein
MAGSFWRDQPAGQVQIGDGIEIIYDQQPTRARSQPAADGVCHRTQVLPGFCAQIQSVEVCSADPSRMVAYVFDV